ncbi:MAG: FG-GAP repeat protein [Planctomycetota bacterium]|nr:FG-GAP repeat protein [Planctomycetota bacterium]
MIPPKDNTPYLSSHIVGRELWQVEINDVKLELPSGPPGPLDAYDRTFDVLMDGDGRLLKIESRWPDGEPLIPPEPEAQATTQQLLYSGNEIYHAFPDEPPLISFVEALDAMARDMGNPLIAKQIKGQYVLWSRLDWEPRPMWVITLRGIPPHQVHGPGEVPVHLRDHLRFIVDPETRRWIFATSTPQPDLDENGRYAFAGGIPAGTVEFYLDSPAHQQNVNAGQVITWQIEAAVSVLDPYGLSMFSVDLVQDSTSPTPNPNLIDIPRAEEPELWDRMAGFNRPAGISNPGPDGFGSGYGGTQIGLFGQKNLQQIGGGQNTFGVSGGAVGQDIVVEDDIGKGGALELLAAGDFNAPCTPGDYTFTIENGVAYLLDVQNVTDNYWEVKQATVDIPAATASFTFTVDPGPLPCEGACCLLDNTCTVATQAACEDLLGLNGTYHGDDTVCAPDHGGVDCTMGACCRADGICEDMTTFESCTGLSCPTGQNCPQHTFGGNEYMGAGTSCASAVCAPPPTGACCIGEGTCLDGKTEFECNSAGGGYHGPDILCIDIECTGACCMPDSQPCVPDQTAVQCYDAGGNYQGDETDCAEMDCTSGACCLSTAACYEGTEMSCDYEGGLYGGESTDCTSTFCENCADGGGAVRCPANEFNKLTADDAAAYDRFGHSVAIDGTVAVVGSPQDNDKGNNSGSVYVTRDLDNDACIEGTEEATITPSDAAANDQFGAAVAIAGDFIVVGAPYDNDDGGNSGSAYVFKYSGTTWEPDGPKLHASDAAGGDVFGWSVAISGDGSVAVIGAFLANYMSEGDAGSAYVFRRYEDDHQCSTDQNCVDVGLTTCAGGFCDGVAWVQEAKLIAPDAWASAWFGITVDIDYVGSTVVVGAPGAIALPVDRSGKAYVFEYTLGTWPVKAELIPEFPMSNDVPNKLTMSTSITDAGDVVLVGSPWDDSADACLGFPWCESGAAYVYKAPGGGWAGVVNEDARITSCDLDVGDNFGWSVSISGDGSVALIGAPYAGDEADVGGATYAYRFNGTIWYEEAKFTGTVQANYNNEYGFAVSLSDDTGLIGAPGDDHAGTESGGAYVFRGVGDCDATGSLDICEILADPRVDFPIPHDCCETHSYPGCSDAGIECCVCYGPNPDLWCCEVEWDDLCVAHVEDPAFGCTAACDEGNGIPYACEDCPADLDGNGDVGPFDLALLLGVWGPCPAVCPEDLSGDCEVGAFDLAILLGSWGPCPTPLAAHWNGGRDKLGALRFALGGGPGCLSLEDVVQMMGYADIGEFIEWVLSEVPPEWVYQVAQFVLWLLEHWPC